MKKNIKAFFNAIKYCMILSWNGSKIYTCLRILIIMLYTIMPYFSLSIFSVFLNLLSIEKQITVKILIALICMVLVNIFNKIVFEMNIYIENMHSEILEYKISEKILEKTIDIDMEFFDSTDYLDILQAVLVDSISINNIIWNIFSGISGLISLIISLILLCKFNCIYPITLLISCIPTIIISRKFAKNLYKLRMDNLKTERKINYLKAISSDKKYALDVRIFDFGDFLLKKYKMLNEYYLDGKKKLKRSRLLYIVPFYILPEVLIFVYFFILMKNIMAGSGEIGDFTLFSGLASSLLEKSISTIGCFSRIYEDKMKVDTVEKFEELETRIEDDGTKELVMLEEVEFLSVSFKYPLTDVYVLKDISFKIEKGQRICIIGENGAGKSTIVKLMCRFYEATEGTILINGLDIRKYTLSSIRKAFSISFQNLVDYAFTLRENILISNEYSSDEELINIFKLVAAEGFLKKLPKGLNTHIQRIFSEDGYEASGGEYQKIAMARAINKNSPVLIFDEPTASLDPESEYRLYYNFKNELKDKTIIFISHRLSAVHVADKVLFIEHGKTASYGTHKELLEDNTKYAKMYNLQLETYANANSFNKNIDNID